MGLEGDEVDVLANLVSRHVMAKKSRDSVPFLKVNNDAVKVKAGGDLADIVVVLRCGSADEKKIVDVCECEGPRRTESNSWRRRGAQHGA